VTQIGLKTDLVYYDRFERFAGTTKYPLKKMLLFAWDGLSSFSIAPLRMFTLLGILSSILSLSMGLIILMKALSSDAYVPGWASTFLPIVFFGGMQLIGIGLIGEYIGKIFNEVKRRPRYLVSKSTDHIKEILYE
jgi:hypothetical protein